MDAPVYAVLAGFGLAFISQTVLGWIKLSHLEAKLRGCCRDIAELQEIHPRKANPGGRAHLESDGHPHKLGEEGP